MSIALGANLDSQLLLLVSVLLCPCLEDGSPLEVDADGLVTTLEDGGDVQNTPADGP
ncbi:MULTISPECIES: hypothetical protein [Natrialbaceae]|uniref:hypothetical protein n=1 Tax=Natrialbaceae TaxID=1644061 RepID=UPI00207C7B57|nr:hypothetical protein [Natronococcus sp. CG52]